MDRSFICFVRYGDDHVGEIRLCGDAVVFRRDGRMFRMAMIDTQQGPVVVEGMLFSGHIVERGDLEAAGLVAGF